MKKLLILSFFTLILSFNLSSKNLNQVMNEKEWTVYTSPLYFINMDGQRTSKNIDYKVFDPDFDAGLISLSLWVKNDKSKSILYIFYQKADEIYNETVEMNSISLEVKGSSLKASYRNDFRVVSLNAKVTQDALMNVDITMTGFRRGTFIANDTFKKFLNK